MSEKKATSRSRSSRLAWLVALGGLAVLFALTHLARLKDFPFFADEAIYVRWSQLLIDDPQQYLFFPLNDGKTPLHMWLMAPFLMAADWLGGDMLGAARALSVVVGALQVVATAFVARQLGARRPTQYLIALWVTLLPYWLFHHRMALIDGMLTLLLTLALSATIAITQKLSSTTKKTPLIPLTPTLALAASFGAALWTKLPALLFVPGLALWTLAEHKHWWRRATPIVLGLAGGFALFGILILHPAFGQLFGRGSDFLHPWRFILLEGGWMQTIGNLPTYILYFATYLTWPILALSVAGIFGTHHKKHQLLLWGTFLGFFLPIALLGKVVYSRYLMAGALPLTLSAALSLEDIWLWLDKKSSHIMMIGRVISALLVSNAITLALSFAIPLILAPDLTPFHSSDRTQYLTEWSSGHGIREVVKLLQDSQQSGRVAVATEGRFGTLPDALLALLWHSNVDNLYVEGIGYPVNEVPDWFWDKTTDAHQVLLVINSHRLGLDPKPTTLVNQYCRPYQAPCLQVWDITNYKELEK